MHYKQLTAADRGAIEVLLREHFTIKEIAEKLGVNPSTVSRELSKRSTPSGYSAFVAQKDYEKKRQRCKRRKRLADRKLQRYVTQKLQLGWSPEQIAGRLRYEGKERPCHETIYRWVYQDEYAKRECLYQYLRLGRKKRRKWQGRAVQKSKIPNRVSIHQRPSIVGQRIEVGHYEGDSVIYPYKQAINTLNELTTGLVRFTKLERKTAQLTAQAMIQRLAALSGKTVTVDNGSEFTLHETVTQETGIPVYFADPYCSSQRGANENVNMLLRGYLPKRQSIIDVTQEELDDIAQELNNRPRKRLGFKTPNEMYQLLVQSQKGSSVALGIRM